MAFPASSGILLEFTDPGGIVARQVYLQALANAVKNPLAVPDPSYALSKDLNVYELVRRDAHVKKVMDLRKHMVAGTEWHCAPSRDGNPLDDAAASLGDSFLGEIENFDSAKLNLSEAVFRGSAFAKIVGRRVTKTWVDGVARDWWVPTRLVDVDRRRFRYEPSSPGMPPILKMGSIEKGTTAWKPLDHPEWLVQHVYDDSESTLGYGRGLMDSLYHSWYAKTRLRIELLQAAERWGQGMLIAKILGDRAASTGQQNQQLLTDAVDHLVANKARHALACFVGEEVEVVNGPGDGWQLLMEGLKYHDDEITGLVLGAVLPSGGNADAGSLARAQVEEGTQDSVMRYDRRLLSSTLTKHVMGLCWRLNRANILSARLGLAEIPVVDLSHESRETPAEAADLLKKTLDSGLDVSQAEAYKRTGWSPPKPGEPIVARPVQANPFGAPPAPGESARDQPPAAPDPVREEPEAASAKFSAEVRATVAEALRGLAPAEPVKPHALPPEAPEVPEFEDRRSARVWFAQRTYGLEDDDPQVTSLRALVEAKIRAQA